ncbi:MAG: hypothetical protein JO115_22165 [Pseudonocardiales bacterium]|nr:hypothetical protein [Pseudonocardiales bacterium]
MPRRVAVHALNRIHGAVFSRFARYGFLVVFFLLNACGAAGDVRSGISFKSKFLPVKFRVLFKIRLVEVNIEKLEAYSAILIDD